METSPTLRDEDMRGDVFCVGPLATDNIFFQRSRDFSKTLIPILVETFGDAYSIRFLTGRFTILNLPVVLNDREVENREPSAWL